MKHTLTLSAVLTCLCLGLFPLIGLAVEKERPNIILMIADDMPMKDWATYGNTFAKTPNIDTMARQGLRFNNAFCGSPVCHPARSVLLTGQEIWRLRDAALFGGTLHEDITTYVDLLNKAGYDLAYSGKGWGPGALSPGGRTSPPTGRRSSLAAVLKQDSKRPFCFWWGTILGHREFNYQPDGRSLDAITLPPYIPDTPAVRKDYAGYYQEVEAFDTEVGKVIQQLDKAGVADNTILIITSDHGMPWPRGKGSLYDLGTRVPLIIRWPARIKPGRVVNDFISFTDFAPTFLEAGDVNVPTQMTGKSLMTILESPKSGTIEAKRDRAHLGLEAHPTTGPYTWWLGYMSCRAIRTAEFLYIRNYPRDGHTGWKPTQAGPIVDIMQKQMATDETAKQHYNLCFGIRPEEELYDIKADPHQVKNLAADPRFYETKQKLSAALSEHMKLTGDPRASDDGDIFKHYPVWCSGGGRKMGGYNSAGVLEVFPEAEYADWIKKNFPLKKEIKSTY
ncbi:sulfatase [Lentisphaera marina]|uniref:sulfatase family protein n=1 Tax=Lentisphaera marina TaxID=1111041 RepID=UPI003082437B